MTPKKYNELNELLKEHSDLSAELSIVEGRVNKASIKAAEPMLPEYAEKKARLGEIEGRLRVMAVENPELFPDEKKSHATPFGALSFRKVTFLEIEDEEKTLLRIVNFCGKKDAPFTVDALVRTKQEPNLEALEKLDDVTLALFGIKRMTEEKFSVKPLEVKADKLAKKAKPELKLREAA